jgi:hypothetical protein
MHNVLQHTTLVIAHRANMVLKFPLSYIRVKTKLRFHNPDDSM